MAGLYLKKLLNQTRRREVNQVTQYFASFLVQPVKRTAISQTWVIRDHANKELLPVRTQAFCTDSDAKENLKGKKINLQTTTTIGSVGRKIPHQIIQLIDENGENQGNMHRANVIKILNETGLKLVLITENADPPVYRLMSGQQIHEERLKLKEKQKTNPQNSPVQKKELTFSTAIAQYDLDTKVKQIQQWIDKKYHVKITLQQNRVADEPDKMLALFGQILNTMPEKATYLSQPRMGKGGSSTCVLRHMSEKEIRQYRTMEKNKGVQEHNRKDNAESETLKK